MERAVSPVEWALAGAALVVGLTGAWSPCGFSMVETIGLRGESERRRTTLAACATFTPGAMIGGTVTFGLLALAGNAAHGVGGRGAYLAAAAIAAVAAVLEARGTRIVPQIRRQLPERWRWVMPMPLAAGLYGVLLGLGFTTFVLSFGVWALAGIAFALGSPWAGIAIGVAFGIGRAIPVVALAPMADRSLGIRCTELMAERPAVYRGFRIGDALGLLVVAVALTAGTSGTASAAHSAVDNAFNPSAAGDTLAFQRPGVGGVLLRDGQTTQLPGKDPAIGGPYVAVLAGPRIKILDRQTLDLLRSTSAKGADAVAVSGGWLVYRVAADGRDALRARRLRRGARVGKPRLLTSVARPSQLGRPSLDVATLTYASAHRHGNSIVLRRLKSGDHRALVSSRLAALSNPSVRAGHVVYVRSRRERQGSQETSPPTFVQQLLIRDLHGGTRKIYARTGDGVVWSTALDAGRCFFTLLVDGGPRILSVHR
jgi:MFS family permease